MSKDSNPVLKSTYPPLEKPDFKSQIPPHLLTEATEAEKYILENLSILAQSTEWSTKAHLSHDLNLRYTNGRLREAESKIEEITEERGRWTFSAKILLSIIGGTAGFISALWAMYQALVAKGN